MRLLRLCVLMLAFFSCAKHDVAGKPGVDETSNGLAAVVVDSANVPVVGARVNVRPCVFAGDSVSTRSAVTDADGKFKFDTLPTGNWCLQVQTQNQGSFITLDSVTRGLASDSLHLAPLGAMQGSVPLPPGLMRVEIQVLGLAIVVWTNANGYFQLDSLPPGTYSIRAVIPGTDSVVGASDVAVLTGETTSQIVLLPPLQSTDAFSHSFSVIFNTSATGAALTENLYHVPVLLRLDSTEFPRGASFGGADLRAYSAQGFELPLEIQAWDSVSRSARVWVRLDTLNANDSIQNITLRWGNHLAVSHSFPASVFDTTDGWDLVWHLSNATLDSSFRPRIPDATAWKNDAKLQGMTLWVLSPLGQSLYFDGNLTSVSGAAANVELGRRSFTLEFWMQTDVKGAMIFNRAHSDEAWNHHHRMILLGKPAFPAATLDWYPSFVGWGSPNIYATCSTAVDSSAWVHMTLRRTMQGADSGLSQWFLNGMPMATTGTISELELDDPIDSLFLGKGAPEGGRKFRGSLAEFRISRMARSDAWIHLNYLNQAGLTPWIHYR